MADHPSQDSPQPPPQHTEPDAGDYRVLARKYRPATFQELIGQDALVRTLTNAISTGRVAHAFMLTGVRGIGKTTSARIIARALNCIGPDGAGGPTPEPCGVCEHCVAIAEDRHVDVIEMDAASHTKVEQMRDLLDGVRYRPVSARYKVYVIDEVHMLSGSSFNAMLKTLEEPPEHVKFVFATTEIRKVPVTVLSRCQRFDLRRLDQSLLAEHLTDIAGREGATLDPEAIAVIARAADGSVRDGLSLLDQVISQTSAGAGTDVAVTPEQVRDLLGLADRSQTLDLLDLIMKGDAKGALDMAADMYRSGAEPLLQVQDLCEAVHWITRLRVTPEAAALGAGVSETGRKRASEMAQALTMPILTRAWQMLLKGVQEVQFAPQPATAFEMLLVRLCYVAELPAPGDLAARLAEGAGDAAPAAKPAPPPARSEPKSEPKSEPPSGPEGPEPPSAEAAPDAPGPAATPRPSTTSSPSGGGNGRPTALAVQTRPEPEPAPDHVAEPVPHPMADADHFGGEAPPRPRSFEEVVALFETRREAILHAHLWNDVHPVRFEPRRLEINLDPAAPADLPNRVGALLTEWTGERWVVSVSAEPGAPTLRQAADAADAETKRQAAEHPLVRKVLETFPDATIESVRDLDGATGMDTGDGDADGERAGDSEEERS